MSRSASKGGGQRECFLKRVEFNLSFAVGWKFDGSASSTVGFFSCRFGEFARTGQHVLASCDIRITCGVHGGNFLWMMFCSRAANAPPACSISWKLTPGLAELHVVSVSMPPAPAAGSATFSRFFQQHQLCIAGNPLRHRRAIQAPADVAVRGHVLAPPSAAEKVAVMVARSMFTSEFRCVTEPPCSAAINIGARV